MGKETLKNQRQNRTLHMHDVSKGKSQSYVGSERKLKRSSPSGRVAHPFSRSL